MALGAVISLASAGVVEAGGLNMFAGRISAATGLVAASNAWGRVIASNWLVFFFPRKYHFHCSVASFCVLFEMSVGSEVLGESELS